MPPQVLPTRVGIDFLAKELLPKRCDVVQGLEYFRRSTKDELTFPPRPREGAELGFVYEKGDLSAFIWTSFVLGKGKNGAARQKDCGWGVIEQRDGRRYFIEVHRTENFIDHLLMEMRIAVWRIRTRPTCSICNKPMDIAIGKGRGSRFWRCALRHDWKTWDHEAFLKGLPEEAKHHLRSRRSRRKAWQDECKRQGKKIRAKMFHRRAWRRFKLPVAGF